MALPHIELLDTFAVWRDYFNFVVDEFNTASALPSANTLVRRDANGAIAVTTLSFVGTGIETLENKIIDAANNTLILSLNDLQDVTVSSTPNNNQILRYNTTSGNWIVANETVYTEYTDSDVDAHLNKNSASNNQVLSWTGSDYAWITQTALYSNSEVDTHLNTSTASTNQILSWTGSDYDWIDTPSTYSNSEVDTHLNTSTASTNQILSWNGSDYDWIDTSSTYSNSDVDTHLNTGTASTNQILKWNGSDYTWADETPEADTLDSVISRGSTTTTTAVIPFLYSNQSSFPNASTYHGAIAHSHSDGAMFFAHNGVWVQLANDSDIPNAYTNSSVDTHLNTGTATANQVLSWTGTDYNWVNQSTSGSGSSSTVARTTVSATTASIANDASDNITITGFKSYYLLKIQTDAAAWVTLYIDTASRSADANRNILTDPIPADGVIAEAILPTATSIKFAPAVLGWNNDSVPSTSIYAKVVNQSGSTRTITTTLTLIQVES